jgi:hypothetical protein
MPKKNVEKNLRNLRKDLKMANKYILLAGRDYYPARWDDFWGVFDSVEEAEKTALGTKQDWYQIISTESWGVVKQGYIKLYMRVI